jgi:hypothetical protein
LGAGTALGLRTDERALVASAGVVFALASAGAALAAAAADGLFLAEIGAAHLGEAVAASSALLAAVLAVVGGLVDRLDRRRVLAVLAAVSAVVVAGLAAAVAAAPGAVAIAALVGGKQLAAATDLAFWVVIAERVDARRSARMLPVLAAVGGLGAAAGAWGATAIAPALGARGVLVAAACMLAAACVGASRLSGARRVGASSSAVRGMIARSWRDGARAVAHLPLARHLAVVVAVAGVFASLVYMALGVAVAERGGDARELVGLLGEIRGAGQLATLVVQVAIAPWLFARAGTGRALLVAPVAAVVAGCGLVAAPVLAMAIAAQMSARVLDAAVETPGEKVALMLLPTASRGRVGGFLDGPAKRGGAVLGGLLAAALAGAPAAFYAVLAGAGALWLAAAWWVARELPALAIERAAGGDLDSGAVLDERAIAALVAELAGTRPERAAEVLSRASGLGPRTSARDRRVVDALARAAIERGGPIVWRSLVAVLDAPAPELGPALAAAASVARDRDRVLAIRAVGLAGGAAADLGLATAAPVSHDVALATAVAIARLARDGAALRDALADALRDGDPALERVAIDELAAEVVRDGDDAIAAASLLARALRRRRGDATARAGGFAALARVVDQDRDARSAELALLRADLLELARERADDAASPVAPPDRLVSLIRTAHATGVDSAETAAALRLYGALLAGADAALPEDIRRIAHALGEPDDDVRAAAEDALAQLGPAAAGELLEVIAWGRRRARDRAAALLADLPVTPAALDRLVDGELAALHDTATAIAVLRDDELVARRLDERLREIAHTVLLLVAARRRSPAIARAAAAWRRAHNKHERARALAVVEATLPRALVGRLVDAVDDTAPAERAAALIAAGAELPARDAVVRAELAGRDRLARALVLHALGSSGRSAHRDAIARAAHDEATAAAASPLALLARLRVAMTTDPDPETAERTDMPTRVETLIALGRVPMLAALTTRQLADVAERARWVTARDGALVTAGDAIDALIVVDDGELELAGRRIGKGEVVDELAPVAPIAAATDLRVVSPARVIRLERADFEELVDDVPGLAAAVCRALGERARRAEDAAYRSPLASRG